MHKNFSHIYVEQAADAYPRTIEVLRRFPNARRIPIDSYKDVFNRPQQEWQIQKQSQKLILAVKPDGLLYPGTNIAPDFGHDHFYYNTLLLNCVYDCAYCYLQGLYQSANLVLFVNEKDFFSVVREKLREHGSLYLCISYDTDLLGFESLFGLNASWIEFAKQHPALLIESRTKSANFSSIAHLDPLDNFILAWTLSPDSIRDRYEPRTPPLAKRLTALSQALESGWPVRICIDPMLLVPDWHEIYTDFFRTIERAVPLENVKDISIGSFRMNTGFLKNIRRQERSAPVLYYPFEVENGVASYGQNQQDDLFSFAATALQDLGVPAERVLRAY